MIGVYRDRNPHSFRAVYYNGHNADEVKEMAGDQVQTFDGSLWLMGLNMERLIPAHSYVVESISRRVYTIISPQEFDSSFELVPSAAL